MTEYKRREKKPAEVREAARVLYGPEGASTVSFRIQAARRAFGSDAELAAGLGIDRSQLTRWRQGQTPDRENADRLAGLDVVVELLSGYLSPSSIPKWLNGFNAQIGNRRPIAVLRAGRLSEVIAAIEAEKGGAFA